MLLFNWSVCIVLECVAVEILFQIPWRHLKFQNITPLRYFVFVVMLLMGLVTIYTMWQLCMEVYDAVLSHQEYSWMIIVPPMCLAVFTAMSHAMVLGELSIVPTGCMSSLHHVPPLALCIPVQVIIMPLECNRNIPNIKFTSHATLVVNLWLFIHFMYLTISYSHYSAVALFYRLCCTMWMIAYCYPEQTQDIYHILKSQLPEWIKKCLRQIRDKYISKVWRNLRAMIKLRRREEAIVDNQMNLMNPISILRKIIKHLWVMLVKFWLPCISCMLATCLLKYYTGWDLASVLIISFHCVLISYFFHKMVHHVIQLKEIENYITVVDPTPCSDKIHYP